MSWTKRQLIRRAYKEIGYNGYDFDLQPEQLQDALHTMDAMMASWYALGINVRYPLPSSQGSSDIDAETDTQDSAIQAIYTNLAIRIAPTIGKTVSAETRLAASDSYDALALVIALPSERQYPADMPLGAGNKPYIYDAEYMDEPEDTLDFLKGT